MNTSTSRPSQLAAVRVLDAADKLRADIERPRRLDPDLSLDEMRIRIADRRDLIATRHDVRDGL